MLTCVSLLLLPRGIGSDLYSNRYSVELRGLGDCPSLLEQKDIRTE